VTPRARLVSLHAVLAAALSLAACREHAKDAQAQAPPVAAVTVAARDLEERIGASGELEAQLRTTLAAEIAGRITRIVLEEGAPVVAGTIVVEIDPERRALELDEAKAHTAQAEARLSKEKRETDRMRTLFQSKVASQSKLDGADTALEIAQADAAAARAQLGVARRALTDASVSAPFAGLLARRHVNVGEFVQPGAPLFDLVSLDPIDVVFHLAEVDSSRVAVGQEVEVHVAPFPDRVFDARVAMVSPTIDPATRTLRVKATLPNPEGLLRPGLFARADLGVAERRGVTLIPSEAVLQRANGPIVFVVGPGDRVQKRDVQLGAFYRDGVEVQAGVAAGEVVVTRGHSGLIDGAVVRIAESDGHSSPPAAGAPPGVASAAEPTGPSL
jgi:membrane fusion protein (multidrug efflux system)